MDSKRFTYGKWNSFGRAGLFLSSVMCILFGLIYLWGLISLLIDPEAKVSLSPSQLLWYFIGFSVWSPIVYTFLSYLVTDIVLQEDGLQIKFIFKTFFISWNDIAEFRSARVFGLPMLKKASIVVMKNGLTPFHRLYGLMYGKTIQPSLLIWSYISNYEELVVLIKQNLKRKRNAN